LNNGSKAIEYSRIRSAQTYHGQIKRDDGEFREKPQQQANGPGIIFSTYLQNDIERND